MAEQQLFDSVEAKQHKRPDMNGDLRLGFASNDFAGAKWKNLTVDYSHLTVLWGVCKSFQARLDEKKEWQVGQDNDSRSRRPRTAAPGLARGPAAQRAEEEARAAPRAESTG